jgi:hypothetical protein
MVWDRGRQGQKNLQQLGDTGWVHNSRFQIVDGRLKIWKRISLGQAGGLEPQAERTDAEKTGSRDPGIRHPIN